MDNTRPHRIQSTRLQIADVLSHSELYVLGTMGWTNYLTISVRCGETARRGMMSKFSAETSQWKTHLRSRKYFFGQRSGNCSSCNIVAGEPAPATIHLAIPPAAWITIQHVYNLAGVKCQARRIAVIGSEIVHGQHVVWVPIFGEGRRRTGCVAPNRVCVYGR